MLFYSNMFVLIVYGGSIYSHCELLQSPSPPILVKKKHVRHVCVLPERAGPAFIYFSAFSCFSTALNFYPHWFSFGFLTVLLGTLRPSPGTLFVCASMLLFLLLLCQFETTFFFLHLESTKASALAFQFCLSRLFLCL